MDDNYYFSNEHIKNIFINITRILMRINDKEKIINDTDYNFILNEEIPDPNCVDEHNSWLILKNNIKNNINVEDHYYYYPVSKSSNNKYHYYLYYSIENDKYYKVMIFNDNKIIINKY